MMAEIPNKRPSRISGSENRQRTKVIAMRLTVEEAAALSAAAEGADMTVAAYVRTMALGSPGPRAARRPVPLRKELAQALGEVGKIGSNLNQLAKAFNTAATAPQAAELAAAQADIMAMRAALMEVLGRKL